MSDEPTAVRPEVSQHANDILVSLNLMDDTIQDVEKHRVDEAILLRHAAETLRKKAVEMIAALDLHLVSVMEWGDTVDHAGWHYRKGRAKERERFDHEEIRHRVTNLVRVEGEEYRRGVTGKRFTFYDGVAWGAKRAAAILRDIYLSESTKAKVTELDRYGIPRTRDADGTVRHWEKGPVYIDVSPIQSEPQQ